jgi:gamma-glutamylputrescine oxidase
MNSSGPQGYYAASIGRRKQFGALQGAVTGDVCIVGAGYTGLSAALHCVALGATVIVLESETVGYGASGRNGGQIHPGHRHGQIELEEWLGDQAAHDLWTISENAVSLVRELASSHAPDCELKDGLLVAAHDNAALRELDAEAEHLQSHYGHRNLRMLDCNEVSRAVGADIYPGGRFDPSGGHLHPLRYALGLAAAASAAGAVIYEQSRATNIAFSTRGATVSTDSGQVQADKVLIACDAFSGRIVPSLAPYIGHVESFIVATEPLGSSVAACVLPSDWAVSDTRHVLDYYRKSLDGRLLFAGRESYWNPPKDIAALVQPRMLHVFPSLKETKIEYAWSGTVGITYTRMPHFGRLGASALFAHGYSGHGVALATMAGKVLAEAALGRSEEFEVLAGVPAVPFPGPQWLRKPMITAALLWYKLQDAL